MKKKKKEKEEEHQQRRKTKKKKMKKTKITRILVKEQNQIESPTFKTRVANSKPLY